MMRLLGTVKYASLCSSAATERRNPVKGRFFRLNEMVTAAAAMSEAARIGEGRESILRLPTTSYDGDNDDDIDDDKNDFRNN